MESSMTPSDRPQIKFRARVRENGKPILFYQKDQYLTSFLRRVTSFLAYEKDGEEGKHESYLDDYALENCLDRYTGINDKNNKEIYEGDIYHMPPFDGRYQQVVEWHRDAYLLPGSEFMEVVGNVWENPGVETHSEAPTNDSSPRSAESPAAISSDRPKTDELTFEQQQEITKIIEGYRTNPSNSNKLRYELFAHIEALISKAQDQREIEVLDELLRYEAKHLPQSLLAVEIKRRLAAIKNKEK